MSSTALTPSTDRQACSSDDVSRIHFATHWGPTPSEDADAELSHSGEFHFRSVLSESGFGLSATIDVCFPSGLEAPEIPAPVLNRIFCHWVIQKLSEQGLPEAIEALSEIARFDQLQLTASLQMSTRLAIPVAVGSTYVRPVFPVTDEE